MGGKKTIWLQNMTNKEKEAEIRKWFSDNWKQLEINAWKVSGKRQDLMDKWGFEILAHVTEEFLGRDIEATWKIYQDGKLENYLTRGMALQLKSSTSTFYHKYRKKGWAHRELHYDYDYGLYYEGTEEKVQRETNIELIQESLEELDFYDRYLLQKYYFEDQKCKDIAETTNIQSQAIARDIKKALHKLKNILLEKNIEL